MNIWCFLQSGFAPNIITKNKTVRTGEGTMEHLVFEDVLLLGLEIETGKHMSQELLDE